MAERGKNCKKCDGYGVVPVNGIAVKCDEPGCRGYVSHAQALQDICPFCAIVYHEAPATIVREWFDAIAIVPLDPVTPGHVLVIPREHVKDALTDPDVLARTMRHAAELAESSCNIITSVGREATQSVFHLHVHIVPRRADDGLPLPWTPQQASVGGLHRGETP